RRSAHLPAPPEHCSPALSTTICAPLGNFGAPPVVGRESMRTRAIALLALLATLPLGCADEQSPAAPARPFGHAPRGGSVVIDRQRQVAYAADADNSAIYRVDLLSAEVTESKLSGSPEQIVLLSEDRLAVTLRDRNQVEILAVDPAGSMEK